MALLHLEPLSSRTTKGDLLRFLCEKGGLDRAHVGRIDIQGRTATIEVPDARIARAREERSLCVAFDDAPEDEEPGALHRLDLAPDEAARLRQRQALERARCAQRDRLAELRQVLLGEAQPAFLAAPEDEPLAPG